MLQAQEVRTSDTETASTNLVLDKDVPPWHNLPIWGLNDSRFPCLKTEAGFRNVVLPYNLKGIHSFENYRKTRTKGHYEATNLTVLVKYGKFRSKYNVTQFEIYRVIQEESAILWEMIVCVILSKKVHMNMGPILNGYRDMVKSRYGLNPLGFLFMGMAEGGGVPHQSGYKCWPCSSH